MVAAKLGDLQDGMLAHYLTQVGASDVNVEARLEREPFDYREMLHQKALRRAGELNVEAQTPPELTWPRRT